MTEYLILSLTRAVPLVWEYNREITFDVTFRRTYGNIPRSTFARTAGAGSRGPSFTLDSTSKRIFRAFGTPPAPTGINGIKAVGRPRLHKIVFTLMYHTGNPQFRIDLHYANSDGTPGSRITSFTPSVITHDSTTKSYYVNLGDPPSAFTSGFELEWNRLYSIVLVPTVANNSNYAQANSWTGGGDTLVMKRIGYSTDSGSTWTISDGYDWFSQAYFSYITVAYAFYYESSDVTVPIAKSSEAFRSYFNGWVSRTTLPSGFNLWRDYINGVSNLSVGVEVPVSDAYTHSVRFYTTADVTGFTQADVASFKWKYNINPVTIDMFYASEAYLQQIDFLDSGTNSVRLNDSYEQEFSGAGGSSIVFDPPVLWWKAQVLSGRVRLKALVFE
jgi:hypothetical protein